MEKGKTAFEIPFRSDEIAYAYSRTGRNPKYAYLSGYPTLAFVAAIILLGAAGTPLEGRWVLSLIAAFVGYYMGDKAGKVAELEWLHRVDKARRDYRSRSTDRNADSPVP